MIRTHDDPQVGPDGKFYCRGPTCSTYITGSSDPARADGCARDHGWPAFLPVGLYFTTTKGADDFAQLKRALQVATTGPGCILPKARVVAVERFAEPLGLWLLQDGIDAVSLGLFAPQLAALSASRSWAYQDRSLCVSGRACSWSCHDAAIARATAEAFTDDATKGAV